MPGAAYREPVTFAAALLSSIAILPGFHTILTGPGGGTVLGGTFPGSQRPGFVYLPPGYDPSRRYPVVYLLHGLPGSPSEFLFGTRLASFADDGIAAGRLTPFIAVAPAAGPDHRYDGEWAGPYGKEVVNDVVPWVDRHLSTIATPVGRTIAGLSAGGYGAFDLALRNPGVFGTVMSWSGYFHPLRDGPFKGATRHLLDANDPTLLARQNLAELLRSKARFFLSTGPYHSHWFTPADTFAFASELHSLGLPVKLLDYPHVKGEWQAQLDAGLEWALAPRTA